MIRKEFTLGDGADHVKLGVSANTPFEYFETTGRDLTSDMELLSSTFNPEEGAEESSSIPIEALLVFGDIAYTMAKAGSDDPASFPASRSEWLESLNGVFSIYEIMPHLLEMWGMNTKQTVEPKKNRAQRRAS